MPLDQARIGENSLPSWKTWKEFPAQVTIDASLRQPTESGLRGLSQGALVYKVGATSGVTVGRFNQMKSDVRITEDKHLLQGNPEEFAYCQGGTLVGAPPHPAFGMKSDSGSVVWGVEGRAVGLLFRG
ncbi:hypothetical protein B0T25DRAFT_301556 [Lasiosphaeria hispida]|uniref:Uncharacterized protein n=1 Tax=Lasiosphaeria hispida TaxID=260671 RepID=A0AAJ0H829_9PEZI|nr:hypothetical protein B0T25DRAFT_301556 [Lasiosphaeria hispida]